MADREAPDIYADQMGVQLGGLRLCNTFALSNAGPEAKGAIPVATVRLSLEHLKVMAYIFRRVIMDFESRADNPIPMLSETLAKMEIPPDAWQRFWEAD